MKADGRVVGEQYLGGQFTVALPGKVDQFSSDAHPPKPRVHGFGDHACLALRPEQEIPDSFSADTRHVYANIAGAAEKKADLFQNPDPFHVVRHLMPDRIPEPTQIHEVAKRFRGANIDFLT